MPYRPSQRKHAVRTHRIKMGDGESFAVTYRPGAITDEVMARMQIDGNRLSGLAAVCEELIVSWELEDDQGQQIPVTEEAIFQHLDDITLLDFILTEVVTDARPGEGKLKPLRRGS